jgi:TPM domain
MLLLSRSSIYLVLLLASAAQAFAPIAQSRLETSLNSELSRRNVFVSALVTAATAAVTLTTSVTPAMARLEAVNRPDLLPKEMGLNVIQTEKFLTTGQARRMNDLLTSLEKDTGFRVRVLCQNYPNTPGLAIRDYWDLGKEDQKDDKYVVLVVDQFGGKGNVLNFNVGDGVKIALPNVFWTRLSGKYGTVSMYLPVNESDDKEHVHSVRTKFFTQYLFRHRPFTSKKMESISR